MRISQYVAWAGFFLAGSVFFANHQAHANAAQAIFQHVTGVRLGQGDPRLLKMQEWLDKGDRKSAAFVAVDDDLFYETTLRSWIAAMTAKDEDPREPLNDMQALIFGIVRDGLDARLMLTGDLIYGPDPRLHLGRPKRNSNGIFDRFQSSGEKLRRVLTRIEPQWEDSAVPGVGILTTRGWAKAYYSDGTNRRAIEAMFRIFMCAPSLNWRYPGLPDHRIRRDVDRRPGGNPETFQKECRTCHAPMDGLTGAFAHFDFVNNALVYSPDVIASKYNQNVTVYPDGYETIDDSWINWVTRGQNRRFGWTGPLQGEGVAELASMFAASSGFKECMVKRVFRRVCKRDLDSFAEATLAAELGRDFAANGYSLKNLFASVAGRTECVEE